MKKRTFIYFILSVFFTIFLSATAYAETVNMDLFYDGVTHKYSFEKIKLIIDGEEFIPEIMPPVLIDGSTYIPLSELFQKLGAVVSWKQETQEAYVGYGDDLVIVQIGSKKMTVNGVSQTISVVPRLINNKTMVPVRPVAEALGFNVEWVAKENAIIFSEGIKQPETPIVPEVPVVDLSADIEVKDYPVTSIYNIEWLHDATNPVFKISAKEPVSKITKFVLDNKKIVVDIYNANFNIPVANIPVENSPNVMSIRSSQFQTNPNIVRVVFDLISADSFRISLSEDRKEIYVSFGVSTINSVSFNSANVNDFIEITGTSLPTLSIFYLSDPYRIVADIYSAHLGNTLSDFAVEGNFLSGVRMGQFDSNTVRLVFEAEQGTHCAVKYGTNNAVIEFYKDEIKNISELKSEQGVISIAKNKNYEIDLTKIVHIDNYNNLTYILQLPGDYVNLLGRGTIDSVSDKISSISIRNNKDGNTEIVISEKSIYAYKIWEDDANIYIKPVNPKEVYPKILYVDAGHGGGKNGAEYSGVKEKNLNLSVTLKLLEFFKTDTSIKIYAVRTDDTDVDNYIRAQTANEIADLYLSIHHNAIAQPHIYGMEFLYYDHSEVKNPFILSSGFAKILESNLTKITNNKSRGLIERPKLIVLNSTTIPAVLVELGYMTNTEEMARLRDESYQLKEAEALYKSITEVFSKNKPAR